MMSNLTATIDPRHIPALVSYLTSEGYAVSQRQFEQDGFLLNHAERLEPGDVDAQRKLLQDMIDVRNNFRMWE